MPQPPISEIMGFHLTEAEPGRVVFEGVPNLQHYNPIGSGHGGFAATLLDSATRLRDLFDAAQGRRLDHVWSSSFNYVRGMSERTTGPVRAPRAALFIAAAPWRHRKAI